MFELQLGHWDFFFFVHTVLLSIFTLLFLPSSSVSLSYFNRTVSKCKCLGEHSCMGSKFSIAIQNGTCCLFYAITVRNSRSRVMLNLTLN